MENQSAKYYEAVIKHYNIPNSEYIYKEYDDYSLLEINNDLFVIMTEDQIRNIRDSYIEDVKDSIRLPYSYQDLIDYIDKESYAVDHWYDSVEYDFIETLVDDDGFRFTYIDSLYEIPFLNYDD